VLELRPEWGEVKVCADGVALTDAEKKEIKPIERIKMVMTRGKDDPEELYHLLGTKDDRKEMDRQFKNEKSNFKIAIVVDMWLTGFDVPLMRRFCNVPGEILRSFRTSEDLSHWAGCSATGLPDWISC
jgi:type I restriction enzyme R subunit